MNRPYLGAQELRNMLMAEAIVEFYRERSKSDNWNAWALLNPDKADLLNKANEAALKQGLLK